MSDNLANLIASKMIARPDVKAIQRADGSYNPIRTRWTRADIHDHLSGEKTYGHYLLDTDDTVKMFCLDVDLANQGEHLLPGKEGWDNPAESWFENEPSLMPEYMASGVPREIWYNRAAGYPRWYLKKMMRLGAHEMARAIWEELEIPTAAAYSGNKGYHVYGFTGRMAAGDAREGALIVLETVAQKFDCKFEAIRGDNFFSVDPDEEWTNPWKYFEVEVFPKQTTLAGKDLGNLLRLPLGRNLKSKDPTFFMDLTAPINEMVPVDPEWALTTTDPWKRPGE